MTKGPCPPRSSTAFSTSPEKRNIPVTVDPKFRHFDLYKGVDLFKPNLKELKEGLGLQWESGDRQRPGTGHCQLDQLESWRRSFPDAILLTLSELTACASGTVAETIIIRPTPVKSSTSLAPETPSLPWPPCCWPQGVSPSDLAAAANLAGGLVCETPGVVPIHPADLVREI